MASRTDRAAPTMSVLVDPDFTASALRQAVYDGDLLVLTRLNAVRDFAEHSREQLVRLFEPHDPEYAHEHFGREEMAAKLGAWKPAFIHSERSKKLVCRIIEEAGLPPTGTHYDVPKPRTSFPVGHLTSGIAYAFPWHRDVWYAAPRQQINWWLPVSPACGENAMGFDLASFGRRVPNNSDTFDYYQNNLDRLSTAAGVTRECQSRPAALDHDPPAECVVLPAPGAILLFSGAQLHRSIPNTSGRVRYSVDFRTVDVEDVMSSRGAPSVDSYCTGTAVRDFRNAADDSPFDEPTVTQLYGSPPPGAMLVYPPAEEGPGPS